MDKSDSCHLRCLGRQMTLLFVACVQVVSKNRNEREAERSTEPDIDSHMLWLLMQHLRRSRRRQVIRQSVLQLSVYLSLRLPLCLSVFVSVCVSETRIGLYVSADTLMTIDLSFREHSPWCLRLSFVLCLCVCLCLHLHSSQCSASKIFQSRYTEGTF